MEKHEFEKHDCGALECNFCEVCKLPASNPTHAVEAAAPPRTPALRLAEILKGVEVQIGLCQQGHIPTVEKLLAEGRSWDEIGRAIGWDGCTAKEWYEAETSVSHAASSPAVARGHFYSKRGGPVSHERAKQAARRLINSHFDNADRARASIPAHHDDDDLVLMDYLTETEAIRESHAALVKALERAVESLELEGLEYGEEKAALARAKELQP